MGFDSQFPPLYFKEYWKLRVIGWLTFFLEAVAEFLSWNPNSSLIDVAVSLPGCCQEDGPSDPKLSDSSPSSTTPLLADVPDADVLPGGLSLSTS